MRESPTNGAIVKTQLVRSTAATRIHEHRRHSPHRLTQVCAELPTWAKATAYIGGDNSWFGGAEAKFPGLPQQPFNQQMFRNEPQ